MLWFNTEQVQEKHSGQVAVMVLLIEGEVVVAAVLEEGVVALKVAVVASEVVLEASEEEAI